MPPFNGRVNAIATQHPCQLLYCVSGMNRHTSKWNFALLRAVCSDLEWWRLASPPHGVLFLFHCSSLWKTVSFAGRWSGTFSSRQMRWTRSSCKMLHGKRQCSRSSDGAPAGGTCLEGVGVVSVVGQVGEGCEYRVNKEWVSVVTWCHWRLSLELFV